MHLCDAVTVNLRVTTEALHPASVQLAPSYLAIAIRVPRPELGMYLGAQAAYPACNEPRCPALALPEMGMAVHSVTQAL